MPARRKHNPDFPLMTGTEFSSAGEKLFGTRYKSEMARFLGVHVNQVIGYCKAGHVSGPVTVAVRLRLQMVDPPAELHARVLFEAVKSCTIPDDAVVPSDLDDIDMRWVVTDGRFDFVQVIERLRKLGWRMT